MNVDKEWIEWGRFVPLEEGYKGDEQVIYFPFSRVDNSYIVLTSGKKISPIKVIRAS